MGYNDSDGFYYHEEADLADPGAGFSELLNRPTLALPAAIRNRVVAELADDPTIRQAAIDVLDGAIDEAGLARTFVGKNLFNPDTRLIGYTLVGQGGGNTEGAAVPLAGYNVTDYIPVRAGEPYTASNPRHIALYDANRTVVAGTFFNNVTSQAVTVTPTMNGYIRATVANAYLSTFQLENGPTTTGWEPYRRTLDPGISLAVNTLDPLNLSVDGNTITIASALGTTDLALGLTLGQDATRNGVFNFLRTTASGGEFHTIPDAVAPIRTQQGTVGANHGFGFIGRWASHDKTQADLGSVWTDGTREYVLLKVDVTGAWFGGSYATDANGAHSSAPVAPAAGLSHVSGATHTASMPQAGFTLQQLYPSIGLRSIRATLDNAPVTARRGNEVTIRETYEILDYASIYDFAKANVGTPYWELPIEGAVRFEAEWRIRAGLKISARFALTELVPTALASTGFDQVEAMNIPAQQTRYIPGVKAIDGRDWSAGVAHSAITTNQLVTITDLHAPSVPPTTLLDWRADLAIGFALGYEPWEPVATSNAQRIEEAPTNLWDIRSTRKIYPNAITALEPGWGRVEARARRAYLTAAERDSILARPTDALAAAAAMSVLVGGP